LPGHGADTHSCCGTAEGPPVRCGKPRQTGGLVGRCSSFAPATTCTVSDAVERGRASWAPHPEVFKDTPQFPTKRGVWDVLRLGPAEGSNTDPPKRQAYPGPQFPIEALDQLVKTLVPSWRTTADAVQRAYDALVQKVGSCILIVCSQSGQFGLSAALAAPEK